MTSKECINKMIEKYSWLGKEYCRLIENENPYKFNQQVFEEMANKVLQDLERLEKLEKENQELKARCKTIPPLAIKNEKLVKAIEIFKPILDIYTGDGKAYIDCCVENPIITLDLHNDKDFKLYELLKEVVENEI